MGRRMFGNTIFTRSEVQRIFVPFLIMIIVSTFFGIFCKYLRHVLFGQDLTYLDDPSAERIIPWLRLLPLPSSDSHPEIQALGRHIGMSCGNAQGK